MIIVHKKQKYSLLIAGISTLFGMGKEPMPSADPAIAHFSARGNIADSIIAAINKLPGGGYLGFDARWLTNNQLIAAIKEAVKRKVIIEAFLDIREAKNKELAKEFTDLGIKVQWAPKLHAKTFFMSNHAPDPNKDLSKTDKKEFATFVGSANPSNLAQFNKEIMIEDLSENIFKQLWEHHHDPALFVFQESSHSGSPIAKPLPMHGAKELITITPTKPTVYSSQSHDISGSKQARLSKASQANDTSATELYIATMTFDDEAITQELISIASKNGNVTVIVDGSAIKNKNSYQQLLRIYQAGGKVFVYNPKGNKKAFKRYPIKAHEKIILRRIDDSYLTIISSGNITKQSDRELNFETYYPGDKELFATIKTELDHLLTESVDFGTILAHDTYQPFGSDQLPRKRLYLPKPKSSAKRLHFDLEEKTDDV